LKGDPRIAHLPLQSLDYWMRVKTGTSIAHEFSAKTVIFLETSLLTEPLTTL